MKNANFILAVCAMLFLVACQPFPVQKKEQVRVPEIKIGTQGITLSALPNAPPREVFENSVFNIIIEVANKGASDITNGFYSLGTEAQYFSLTRQPPAGRFGVEGKSIFNPEGGKERIIFDVLSAELLPEQRRFEGQFIFTVCYPYTTDAAVQACVDTDLFGRQPQKACVPKPIILEGGQGAPVGITRVEPRMLPHEQPGRVRPDFVITLKNLGRGQLVAPERVRDACTGRPLGREGWGVADVRVLLSDTPLVCNEQRVKIRPDGTTLVCSLPEGIPVAMGTYTAPLRVQLSYGYVNSLVIPVDIVKPTR